MGKMHDKLRNPAQGLASPSPPDPVLGSRPLAQLLNPTRTPLMGANPAARAARACLQLGLALPVEDISGEYVKKDGERLWARVKGA
mmetsp:Transcript_66925/g.211913  ORF Transcript_66925/g.211913 Transcript_66925/m.211913 type:complete len:86 (+) Transcript_66925:1247-1504(+)